MDLVECTVLLGGDIRQQVVRAGNRAVTFPETEILAVVHGEHAVQVGKVCGKVDRGVADEKLRLASIYGEDVVEGVFPGRRPIMQVTKRGRVEGKGQAEEPDTDESPFQSE